MAASPPTKIEAAPLLGEREAEALHGIRLEMQKAAGLLRLPFQRRNWSGLNGNWLGTGIGSSIDFQDHRPYLPGDDPRYIDWQAYARTGHYTMKLYREEVSPKVDLVLDVSASMAAYPAKARRALELFYFCVESTLQNAASLRVWIVAGHQLARYSGEEILTHRWTLPAPETKAAPQLAAPAPDLHRVEGRTGAMRVFISDLLYAQPPSELINPLTAAKGFPIIFAPYCRPESAPDWEGNLRLVECETRFERNQRVDRDLVSDYQHAYQRHFSFWLEETRKRGGLLARIPAEGDFLTALQSQAAPAGAVEPCH
ncbi:MAG: DUF58 domain-containing protein [Verrucomicrobiota bacterium]